MGGFKGLVLTVLLLFSVLIPCIVSGSAQNAEPRCPFQKYLPKQLPCHMDDEVSLEQYTKDQKFCACPTGSECFRREVEHPTVVNTIMHRFICDHYAPHDDMTDGLLRDNEK